MDNITDQVSYQTPKLKISNVNNKYCLNCENRCDIFLPEYIGIKCTTHKALSSKRVMKEANFQRHDALQAQVKALQ